MTSSTSADNGAGDPLAIRPPLQRRSREAWARVLDAGVALLAEGGYEAFTIAAVCDRAQVAPRAIYARTDSKDALFLAVYEHGLARVRADQGSSPTRTTGGAWPPTGWWTARCGRSPASSPGTLHCCGR